VELFRGGFRKGFWILLFLMIWPAPVGSGAKDPLRVTVSILPQKYFVERISGDLADISVMVPPGASPATYEPRPSQMKALVGSKIYFAVGVPFEKVWLKKFMAANRGMKIVQTDQWVEKMKMPSHHGHEGEAHKHRGGPPRDRREESGLDPHIWLSPPLVNVQAETIARAIMAVDPVHRSMYEKNLADFQADVNEVDSEIRRILGDRGKGGEFMVFHPSWGYFAEAYGLRQIPVEVEGKEPSASEMADLISYAKTAGIKVIFVQPQFSSRTAETIAGEIGAKVVPADPLREDWRENLLEVAKKIRDALR